jgi:signal transduction histidine kinase
MRQKHRDMPILWYRWLALVIGTAGFVAGGQDKTALSLFALGTTVLYTLLLTGLRIWQRLPQNLWPVTIVADVVVGSWVLAATGGANSAFLPYYLVPVLEICLRASTTVAIGMTVGLGVLFPFLAVLGSPGVPALETLASERFLTGEGIFFLLALLVTLLVGPVLRWRKQEGELAKYEHLFTMSGTQPERVISVITEEALHALEADVVLIFLLGEAGKRPELQIPDPYPMTTLSRSTLLRIEWDEECLGSLMTSGSPAMLVDDECRIPIPRTIRDFFLHQPFLSAPLVMDAEPIGLLLAGRRQMRGRFDQQNLSGMSELAGRAARVLGWTESLHNLQRRYTEVSGLNQVLREINSPSRLESVLQRIVDSAGELLSVDRASVMLLDEGGQTLRVRAVAGAPFREPVSAGVPVGEGISGWVVQHGQSMVIAPEDVPRFRTDEEREVRWALCTPLRVDKRVIGVLNLSLLTADVRRFSQEDIQLAQLLADAAAVAIIKADLMEKVLSRTQELAQANRELSVGRSWLGQTINCIADGVVVLDALRRVILLNDAARRLLDFGDKDVLGLEVDAYLQEHKLEELQVMLRRLYDEATTLSGPLVYRGSLRSEGERVFELQMSPVCSEQDGELQCEGTVTVLRDITVEMEEEQVRAEFITTMAHEMRTPLTSMRGYLELLRSGDPGPLTSVQEDFITRAEFNLDRCINLINNFLDLSRIREGHFSMYFDSIDVSRVVHEVASLARAQAESKQQDIRVTVPPSLEPILASRSGLRQVLVKLLGNAIKHTSSRGQIFVRVEDEDDQLRFAVQDTGVGITESKESVFQPGGLEEGGRGVGLGLYISKKVVEAHGGRIWFESEPGRGTVFYFTVLKDPTQVTPEGIQGERE